MSEAVEQIFQRSDQQRKRRAQFVADIGEKPALGLVQLHQFAMTFFQLEAIAIQFKAQRKFSKAQAIEEIISCNDNDSGERYKI